KATARAGEARLELKGTSQALRPDTDFKGSLVVEHLLLTAAIFDRLPANLQKINVDYAPTGPVSLTLKAGRKAGQWAKHYLVQPEDVTAVCRQFPYPLDHITGALEQVIDPENHQDELRIDLLGFSGPQRVFIKGNMLGEGRAASVDFKIWGDDLPLDA